jgi:hypothetical protein
MHQPGREPRHGARRIRSHATVPSARTTTIASTVPHAGRLVPEDSRATGLAVGVTAAGGAAIDGFVEALGVALVGGAVVVGAARVGWVVRARLGVRLRAGPTVCCGDVDTAGGRACVAGVALAVRRCGGGGAYARDEVRAGVGSAPAHSAA